MINPKILDRKPRDARLLEALIVAAVSIFQFNHKGLGRLLQRVHQSVKDDTLKLGWLPLTLEVVTHEIAHMIVEELPSYSNKTEWETLNYKKKPAIRRRFPGDLNEIHSIAIQTIILDSLHPTKCWSKFRRVLETDIKEPDLRKREATLSLILQDYKTKALAKSFARYILYKALDVPNDYPAIQKLNKALTK